MINVIFKDQVNPSHRDIIDENTTIIDALEASGISYERGTNYVNGTPVTDLSKTFAQLGFTTGTVSVTNVAKTDNA